MSVIRVPSMHLDTKLVRDPRKFTTVILSQRAGAQRPSASRRTPTPLTVTASSQGVLPENPTYPRSTHHDYCGIIHPVTVLVLLAALLGLLITITPPALAQTETILYSFTGPPDGYYPWHNLIQDAAGNLYGVTYEGGTSGKGTVFELTPQGGGVWTQTKLYSFTGSPGGDGDGFGPSGGLVMDRAGNLYGVTEAGGAHDWGAI